MPMKLKKELERGSIGPLDACEAEKRDGKGIDNVSRDTHPGYSHGPYPYCFFVL
jgi:hypothetical protein